MGKTLVTGGAGFIGTNLIPLLLEAGHDVVVLDNETLGARERIAADVEFHRGDIRDAPLVDSLLADVDVVVHLAADTRVMDSIEDPTFNFENNVIGTYNVLSAARKHGVKSLVNASSGGAILGEVPPPVTEDMTPSPSSPYGASKLAVEGYCAAFGCSYGLHCVSLRFANVYGPLSYHKGSVVAAFMKRILADEELIVYGDGKQIRDYINVRDLCRGIVGAIESGKSGVYQLGTGVPVTLNELIDVMRAVTGRELRVRYEPFRDGEIRHTYCDITKARNEIGFNPEVSLEQGIAETWAWFQKRFRGR